jgi:RNA polymerase sigma-70 factor (ECF subfamily)
VALAVVVLLPLAWELRVKVTTSAQALAVIMVAAVVRVQLVETFDEGSRVSSAVSPDLKKELERALQRLTPLQKSLILLKDYEGYSYDEIGKITALNPSQVKVYLHRARLQLRDFVGKPENII